MGLTLSPPKFKNIVSLAEVCLVLRQGITDNILRISYCDMYCTVNTTVSCLVYAYRTYNGVMQRKRGEGFDMVIGVDEAGRGPFAGTIRPVLYSSSLA